jgi:hypothetical protein
MNVVSAQAGLFGELAGTIRHAAGDRRTQRTQQELPAT